MPIEQAFSAAWSQATAGQRHALINAIREERKWACSYRQAHARVLHWIDDEHQLCLPAYVLVLAVEVFGHGDFLEPLHAAELRALRRLHKALPKPESKRMGKVA